MQPVRTFLLCLYLCDYLSPRDGRPLPADERANDLLHWQTRLVVDDVATAAQWARAGSIIFVSSGVITLPDALVGFKRGLLICDPDGHVMQLAEPDGLQKGASR